MNGKVSPFPNQEVKERTQKMMLYIGIFSIVMLFAGFTSAYVVSMSDGFWVKIKQPESFYWSTLVILVSSITMHATVSAVKKLQLKKAMYFLLFTLGLGITFSIFQFKGWSQLIEYGNYFVGNSVSLSGEYGEDYTFMLNGQDMISQDGEFYAASDAFLERPLTEDLKGTRNSASSYIYVLTALHLIHLAGGLIYLFVLIYRLIRAKVDENQILPFKLGASYWHFLGFLWVYLFLFLNFIH